jgi:hypothetical protein
VTKADDYPGVRHCPYLVYWHGFRRDRGQENRNFLRRLDEGKEIGIVHWTDQLGIVRALVRNREMWSLDMQADKSRNLFLRRSFARGERRCRDLWCVGDQRREQGRGAKSDMRIAYGADRVDTRAVIEKRAAAAIDLNIDEAGHEHAALQFDFSDIARQC